MSIVATASLKLLSFTFFRGKNQKIKAVQGASGRVNDTNIQLFNVSSHARQVIDSSGICKVAELEKAVSNSLQHRIEQVAKKVRYIIHPFSA